MLKILLPDSPRDADYLSQMHQVRYQRFVLQYGWTEGVTAINQMEFDKYDFSTPLYIANVGENDRVNGVIRMIHSPKPNYTWDEFAINAHMTEPARAPDILELSCSSTDPRYAPKNTLYLMLGGLIELGMASKIQYYVSTVNELVHNICTKVGWHTTEISEHVQLGDQDFVALKFPADLAAYNDFCKANRISDPLLSSEEIERCQLKQRILGM